MGANLSQSFSAIMMVARNGDEKLAEAVEKFLDTNRKSLIEVGELGRT